MFIFFRLYICALGIINNFIYKNKMFQALHENIKKFALALDMDSWAVMFQLKGSKEKS